MGVAFRVLSLALLAAWPLDPAAATAYFVDAADGDDSRDGLSEATAFEHIAAASAVLVAGDVAWIKGSATTNYVEPIEPLVSGAAASPIRYQGYGSTTPRIVHDDVAAFDPGESCIYFGDGLNLEYIIVDNFECNGAAGPSEFGNYAKLQSASHNRISNCVFRGGDTAAFLIQTGSRYNQIVGNLFDPSGLGLARHGGINTIQIAPHAGFNLVSDNDVRNGGHDAIQVASSFNVIRRNRLANPDYRAIEVIVTNRSQPGFDPAERNLFEDNEVYDSNLNLALGTANAFQLWAPRTIVRRNRFYNTGGNGIKVTRADSAPAIDISDNRIYHNVFYRNGLYSRYGGAGFFLHVKGGADEAGGNSVVNNVIQESDWGSEAQIRIAGATLTGPEGTRIENNVILDDDSGGAVIDFESAPPCEDKSDPPPRAATLSAWQTCHPSLISGNLEHGPMFVDPANRDFRLTADSPLVDAGTFLTRTTSAGAGVVIPVEDASYFYDGFGIEGEVGDLIRLEGGLSARIEEVDYAGQKLIVAEPTLWSAGEGVHVHYYGRAPDIGAHEHPLWSRCGSDYYLSLLVCAVALVRRPGGRAWARAGREPAA